MNETTTLVKKVKRLLKRMGVPKWLHHFGPKTYEFFEHFVALLVRSYCRLSYRRVKKLLGLLGLRCPSKSALQYTAKKLDASFWQKVLKATSGNTVVAALDSTGLSRTNPSYHYLKRIDGKLPRVPVKLSVAFDTRKKRFCAAKIRVLPAHDIRDAKVLLKHSNPRIAVADKAYDAESLYEYAASKNILLMVPKRKLTKKGFYRNMMHKHYRTRTYHRRELAESGFGASKRMHGSSVSSRSVRTIRTEVYSRLACYNIILRNQRLLGQSQSNRNL